MLSLGAQDIALPKILAKGIVNSDLNQFYYDISVVATVPDTYANKSNFPLYTETPLAAPKQHRMAQKPLIVGFGPAGMFAALECIEHGIAPIIFERGKKIEDRSLDIRAFIEHGLLNPESNIQFGEGGAGSYSDGKLFSRRHNSAAGMKVLDIFIKFGAPPKIAYVRKPHVGTDVLCKIAKNIRNYILSHGGEIVYNAKMTDLLVSGGAAQGIVINDEKEYRSDLVCLAIGHSARDTFELLRRKGVRLEQKAVSVGVRIEHPADTINLIRYGEKYRNFKELGAAVYAFNYTDRLEGRGAYTFCMCPGGEIVNASSENDHLALNGMSYSDRASAFSNAALIVPCHTTDYNCADPLAGIAFQREIERKAFVAGGSKWKVPAQNLEDFLGHKRSSCLLENSCKTGTTQADLRDILPGFVCELLVSAFAKWKEESALFVSSQAVLLAPETRTSCPVRIVRDENYESVNVRNLCPLGEGAGYAGGITSAATDAIKAIERRLSAL